MPSSQAVKKFRGQPLDFVYIDGDHGYEAVINDITNYSSKVRPGGIIAGHDYWGRMLDKYLRVGPAVKLYVKAYNIDPWFTIGRVKTNPEFKKDSARTFLWVKE
jgi:predicted O-methyltransferase YrrM